MREYKTPIKEDKKIINHWGLTEDEIDGLEEAVNEGIIPRMK